MLSKLAQRTRVALAIVTATAALSGQSNTNAAKIEFFEQRIRPVLASSCYECHSTNGEQEGGVVLDHRDGIRAEATEGVIVVPGDPSQSVLLRVIRHELEGLEMPEDGAKLSDDVIADFEQWIKAGAVDPRREPPSAAELADQTAWPAKLARRRTWWSLQPVTAPPTPAATEWSQHPIDRFVAAAHRERGLNRAQPASKRVLLRRLHYTITGLPPSPQQLAAFERDDRPDAFEQVVDDLLDSPTYGEQWARHWMDVVRYADSHGSEGDPSVPYAYRYRDYLIRALNADVPYDQLVREHIAGDLLEEPRVDETSGVVESALGTAHYRFVFHGYLPTEPLQEKVRFIDDQINVIGKAFLGHTISCARCHDHKFDAISQADYYAMFGVLSSCRPGILDANTKERQLENVGELRALKRELRGQVATAWRDYAKTTLTTALEGVGREVKDDHPAWLLRELDRSTGWAAPGELTSERFARALRELLETPGFKAKAERAVPGAIRMAPTDPDGWYFYGNGLHDGATASGAFAVAQEGDRVIQGIYPAGAYTHLDTNQHRGVLHSRRFDVGPSQSAWALVLGEAAHLRFVVQDYPRSGLTFQRVNLNHEQWQWRRVDLSYWSGERAHVELTTSKDAPVEVGGDEAGFFGLREVRIQPSSVAAPGAPADQFGMAAASRAARPRPADRRQLAALMSRRIGDAVSRWADDACDDRDALLLNACLNHGLLPNHYEAFEGAEELVQEIRASGQGVPTPTRVAGLIEGDANDHPLFERGDPSHPAETVPRRFLDVLGGTRYDGERSGRRALADDLASPANPLTARVMVNRIWHHLFGSGIVATPDNLGQLGAKPTHPALLDHLATQFVSARWSIKHMIRYMVTSKSWQLASTPPPAAAVEDPEGAWVTHARVRRLTAESLRDSLFAVTGALSEDRYGPPFGANSGSPRRSVYVRSKRNDLDQLLQTFDAPTPFAPVGARLVTNVPAQSLALLNDPLLWRLAERWADATKEITEDGARAAAMFEAATGRRPSDEEREDLLAYLRATKSAAATQAETYGVTTRAIRDLRDRRDALLEPTRAALLKAGNARPGPAPLAAWDFRTGLKDQIGGLNGALRGTARIDEQGLVLDGRGWLATSPLQQRLSAKTMEAWVKLDDLDQSGGGVITVQNLDGGVFDALVYGERQRAKWIAGSDNFNRTDDVGGPAERLAADQPIHLAAVYDGRGNITLYREGEPYGRPYKTGSAQFEAGAAQVLIGLRHGDQPNGRALRGRVSAARLYDRALSAEELAASAAGQPFISRERALMSLTGAARRQVLELEAELAGLEAQAALQKEERTERGPWTLLAHALFNVKEFRFLR